ncbi:MAG: PAS domain-containing hybrid sensor histidine kinase/response regulator [Thermodesulfobacteriota bacterium]
MPKTQTKTRTELETELEAARQQVAELEQSLLQLDGAGNANNCLEHHAAQLIREAPVGVFRSTAEGQIFDVNHSLAWMLGYATPKELIETVNAANIADTLYIDGRQRTAVVNDARSCGKWHVYENQYRRKDGSTITGRLFLRKTAKNGILEGFIEDITQQKMAENTLREREFLYHGIFENTGTAMIIIENDTTVSLANKQFEKLSGYSKLEIENRFKWTDFIAASDVDWMLEQHRLRRKDPDAAEKRYEARTVDRFGNTRHILVTVDMIEGTDQSVASFLDITESKAAEAALQRSEKALSEKEEMLQALMGSLPGMAYRSENRPGWPMVFISQGCIALTGYTPGELVADDHLYGELIHEDDRQRVWDTVQAALGQHAPFQVEYRLHPKNGGEKWVWEQGRAVGTRTDGTRMIEGFITDITTRKQTEDALRESEANYRLLAENTLDCIWTMNLDLEFTYINAAIEQLTGYSPEQWIGTRLPDHMDSDTFERVSTIVREELVEPVQTGGRTFETTIQDKNGQAVPVEIIGRVLYDEAGRPCGLIGTTRDIRERKRAEKNRRVLEAQLRQSQKLEAIGTLAGGIAHDFNNILTSIIGYAELAQMEPEDTDFIKNSIDQIYHAGNRARELVKQILTFSRQTEQEMIAVEAGTLIRETLKLLRSTLPATIEIHEDLGCQCRIIGDPAQIHQIMMNLCTNAVQAMGHQKGTLTVRIAEVELDADFARRNPPARCGPNVKITVSDTGPGIAEGDMAKIFDPFFTTKPEGQGTGLGLSVVHGIVNSHGGIIDVKSDPANGTSFFIYLPIASSTAWMETVAAAQVPTGSESILFIDDERPIAELGKQMLLGLGYRVEALTQSPQALEILQARPEDFDLVVTDFTMPHMTGVELMEGIQKIRPDLPVILCTGYSEQISQKTAEKMGFSAFLMKPTGREEMAKTIRRAIDGS